MSVADKLLQLNQVKQDIKTALENKGVDLTGVDFGGYAGKIDELPAVVELTQAQYDALSTTELVWGLPKIVTGTCSSVGYNPIGTACSIEGDKRIVSGEDLGMSAESGCYELTCIPRLRPAYDDNTYYLIVEE